MTDKSKGNAILLLTAVVWGTGFIGQKLGNAVLPPIAFNSIRQMLAALLLCPILARSLRKSGYFSKEKNTAEQLERKKHEMIKAGILCGLFMLLGTNFQQIGLLTVSAGKSGFISSLYIVFTPLLSVAVGKRVNFRTFLCIAIAIGGFALLSLRGGLGGATAGDWWTLASAFAFASQIVSVNYFVDRDNDILISVMEMGACGIAGILISILIEHPQLAAIGECMPIIIYTACIPTAIGYTLQIVGQKYTDSTTAALIMSLEAVFAAVFGAIFLKEWMSMRELLGCVVIFAAIILDQIELPNKKETEHEK